ncbi:unnamed protein product, partial [Staurois parvus]
MRPLQRPGHLLRPMPASGFCVPVPVTSGRTGGGGKFENLKKFHFFPNKFYIHFVPSALPCALPAFACFLPETEKSPWRPKSVPLAQKIKSLDQLENSDSKSEPLAEL